MEAKVWREMGLRDEEFTQIVNCLGREPNLLEVGIFAVMWSEHCSYKSSRPLLRQFPTTGARVLVGPGENAGILDIGNGLGVAFKMESHNHPSALEPYQGAATGVGGILRDIFTMGARPIAVLDALRFGPLTEEPTQLLMRGVVQGIGGYGNSIGIPTVGGDLFFHPSFRGNPLVNAMAVGVLRHEQIALGQASGRDNLVMIVGARTGRDGIHGATFASIELTEESESKRSAVQVGDPFMEKLLMEACLELISRDILVGIQDMGAAGLTCSSAEMAGRGKSGIELDLDLVPRRETGMTPYELMLSESQERMLVVPKKGREHEVQGILVRWGLEAEVIGRVTDDNRLRLRERGVIVADIPVPALTDDAPVYHRESREPASYQIARATELTYLPESDPVGALLRLLASPNICSRAWVYRQYDHQVGTNTVVAPGGGDAAVLRLRGTGSALALATDCNARLTGLDPRYGGAWAVLEAAQNVAVTGARPIGITDCLNFANPEHPEIFWQFEQACAGISAACLALETPVTGGNVSFYNETPQGPILPVPMIGMVGLLEDVNDLLAGKFPAPDLSVYLLGEPEGLLVGSEYLSLLHSLETGALPELDLVAGKARIEFVLAANRAGLLAAAHDISEGGLAVALVEMAADYGVTATIPAEFVLQSAFFGEGAGRYVLVAAPGKEKALENLATALCPLLRLGETGGESLRLRHGALTLEIPRTDYLQAYHGTITQVMQG